MGGHCLVLSFSLKLNKNHQTVNFKVGQSAFGILTLIPSISNPDVLKPPLPVGFLFVC